VLRFESVWAEFVVVAALAKSVANAYISVNIGPRTMAWILRDKVRHACALILLCAFACCCL
jgi:hypothetical protein